MVRFIHIAIYNYIHKKIKISFVLGNNTTIRIGTNMLKNMDASSMKVYIKHFTALDRFSMIVLIIPVGISPYFNWTLTWLTKSKMGECWDRLCMISYSP